MSLSVKDVCSKFPPVITPQACQQIYMETLQYTARDSHVEALNTNRLGLAKILFLPKDENMVFDIFQIDRADFTNTIYQCKSIKKDWNVTGHPFNIATAWIIHKLTINTTVNITLRQKAIMSLGRLINYRFFSSLMQPRFQHPCNEDVMEYTINNLSGKYAIVKAETNTWDKLIMERVEHLYLSHKSPHFKTFKTFTPDKAVLYAISDPQSRIRNNINLVYGEYIENIKQGNSIKNTSLTNKIGDDTVINNIIDNIDSYCNNTINVVINPYKFIDNELITIVAGINKNIRKDMFKDFLNIYSQYAIHQNKNKKANVVDKTGLLIGYRTLIRGIIQKTYRRIMLKGDSINNKTAVLLSTKNLYSNSRIVDKDILVIKSSLDNFITNYTKFKREQTKIALRLSFILYIILLSFKYG